MRRQFLAAIALALMMSCGKPTATAPTESGADAHGATAATSFTRAANAKAVQGAAARRSAGLRGRAARTASAARATSSSATPTARRSGTRTTYAFVDGDAPPSVNPSLWRQAKLNGMHGLFEVTDGIYQVRGYDISNMTLDPRPTAAGSSSTR